MFLVLGLDLGIGSIGWALLVKNDKGEIERILDLGSRVFPELEDEKGKVENVNRRQKRSIRRQRRRKQRRLGELNRLFIKYFGIDFKNIDTRKMPSPFALKIKGLSEELTREELMIALYHYMKYRGFKSSRKVEDKKDSDNKKLLKLIDDVRIQLSNEKTITKVLVEKFENQPIETRRMHNTDREFYLTVSRDMYEDEIGKIFVQQKNSAYYSEAFEREFMQLFRRQRDYSDGPGEGSPFGSNGNESFIEKNIGKCIFDGNLRAPKNSFSAEAFVLLSFLNNLKFKRTVDDKYTSFNAEQLTEIFEMAKGKKEISYYDIFKSIGMEDVFRIKGLDLTKKQYVSCLKKFKASKELELNVKLSVEEMEEFQIFSKKEMMNKALKVGMGTFYSMKKAFLNVAKKSEYKNEITCFANNEANYDKIAQILLFNKTDDSIKKVMKEKGYSDYIIDVVLSFDEIKKTINLSLPICQQIIPELLKGQTYDKAMMALNYIHSAKKSVEKEKFLPEIDLAIKGIDERLTNPVVRHTLVFMRQVINELIKKYGEISEYNIELSRELKQSKEKRKQMSFDMRDNQDYNMHIKQTILDKYPNIFPSLTKIGKDDVIKYKLFVEQCQRSAYTNSPIVESFLFNDNIYQIDHVIPYSRSYDDSYNNKVLVETELNHDKGNRMPSEAFNSDQMIIIKKFILSTNISRKKIDNLLRTEIDDDFIERNISDTSYIARTAKKLIEVYLQPKACVCPSGNVTDKLKQMWKLKGRTHSYINKNYYNITKYLFEYVCISKDKISLKFNILETNREVGIELEKVIVKEPKNGKEPKELPISVKKLNEAIDFFFENPSTLENELSKIKGLPFNLFVESISLNVDNTNRRTENEHMAIIAGKVMLMIQNDRLKKNRENDLHHALDAAVIAATTPKLIKRVTEYFMDEENNKIEDPSTGEMIDDLSKFPKPYDDFIEELVLRVYERDKKTLLEKINKLSIYNDKPLERRDISVLYPVRLPDKYIAGPFTQETFFGLKNGVLTKRISVFSLNEKNIEKMFEKEASNKPIYETCLKWIKSDRKQYPFHPIKGTPIKKVLLEETRNVEDRIKIGNKFAGNPSCVRVDVYRKEGKDNLFIVPIFYYQIKTEELNRKLIEKGKDPKQIIYQIMWGQGNKSEYINSEKLSDYQKIASLSRYSLIEIELNNGEKGLCYSGGASSGVFEIYSILGDGFDLTNAKLFPSTLLRYQITVSTIKNIRVRNISILGKIS